MSFPVLDEVAAAIRRNADIARLRVEGHTDQAGTPEYNLDLSFRLARGPWWSTSRCGVARERLEFQGFGQQRPVAEADSPDAASLNRRVEFTIVQQGDETAPTPLLVDPRGAARASRRASPQASSLRPSRRVALRAMTGAVR